MAKKSAQSGVGTFSGQETLCVLHGEEDFLKSENLRQLREALKARTGGEVETLRFDGKTTELATVLDELRSFGLMQQHKLVVVDDESDLFVKNYRKQLEEYAEHAVEIATLVLRPGTWNAAWRLHKMIDQHGVVIKCEPVGEAEAAQWAVRRCKAEHMREITPPAAKLLVERLGTNLMLLDGELGKLAVSGPAETPIQPADVERLAGRASEDAAWDIQEALLSGSAKAALMKLQELIDLSGQPDVLITHFVSDMMRKLHQAAQLLGERETDFNICKQVGIWGERQRPFMAAARKLGTRRSAQLLDELVKMDQRSKTGFSKGERNLERFCVMFTRQLQ